ncbi:MAG: hypothetical protein ACTHOE_03235 [Conexibacter sp.]
MLATFALGTAAGVLTAISLNLGCVGSIVLFGVAIALPWLGWRTGRLGPVLAFWAAYALTRPLGASIADWLGKPHSRSRLGLGDGVVSALGFVVFAVLVAYVAIHDVQQLALAPPGSKIRSSAVAGTPGPSSQISCTSGPVRPTSTPNGANPRPASRARH